MNFFTVPFYFFSSSSLIMKLEISTFPHDIPCDKNVGDVYQSLEPII